MCIIFYSTGKFVLLFSNLAVARIFSKTPCFENRTKTRRHKGRCCSVTLWLCVCILLIFLYYRKVRFMSLTRRHRDTERKYTENYKFSIFKDLLIFKYSVTLWLLKISQIFKSPNGSEVIFKTQRF